MVFRLNIALGLAFSISVPFFVYLNISESLRNFFSFSLENSLHAQDALFVLIPFIFVLLVLRFTSVWGKLRSTKVVHSLFAIGNVLLLIHFFTVPYGVQYYGDDPNSWTYYARPEMLIYIDSTFPFAKFLIFMGMITLIFMSIRNSRVIPHGKA